MDHSDLMDTAAKPLVGKVAIVTGGGASAIGRAHALRLAKEGARVVVNDLGADTAGFGTDSGPAQTVAAEIRAAGGEAVANTDSVATMEGAARIVQTAIDHFGRIDILINNAGALRSALIHETTEDDFDRTIGVHLKGTFAMVRSVAPYFVEQRGGVVVNTGSDSGLGHYGNPIYAMAKEGIAGFTRAIARDLGPYNVRSNLIRPGALSRHSTTDKGFDYVREAELVHRFPALADYWLTRMLLQDMPAERIADFVAWLCTDAASHVNGQEFRVKGGEITLLEQPRAKTTIFKNDCWTLEDLSNPAYGGQLHGNLKNIYLPESVDAK